MTPPRSLPRQEVGNGGMSTAEYRSHFRTLLSNLKDKRNSTLVARVCKVDYASSKPSDITLMLASSHTLFNLIFALGALPFCHLGVPLIRRLIPMTPEEIALKDKNQAMLAIEAKKAAKHAAREAKQAMHLAARGVAKPGK